MKGKNNQKANNEKRKKKKIAPEKNTYSMRSIFNFKEIQIVKNVISK